MCVRKGIVCEKTESSGSACQGTDETLSLVHLSAEQGAKGATAQHRNKVPRR